MSVPYAAYPISYFWVRKRQYGTAVTRLAFPGSGRASVVRSDWSGADWWTSPHARRVRCTPPPTATRTRASSGSIRVPVSFSMTGPRTTGWERWDGRGAHMCHVTARASVVLTVQRKGLAREDLSLPVLVAAARRPPGLVERRESLLCPLSQGFTRDAVAAQLGLALWTLPELF